MSLTVEQQKLKKKLVTEHNAIIKEKNAAYKRIADINKRESEITHILGFLYQTTRDDEFRMTTEEYIDSYGEVVIS